MAADPGRSERIRELFLSAVALPSLQRPAFLDDQCGDDPALRAELESLLLHEPGPPSEAQLVTGGIAVQVLLFPAGTRIGAFTIQKLLGAGASGDVYLATQKSPRREVALKILRIGADRGSFERFKLEGAALARLSHDNVAKVFQVGTAPGGRPYIAMELVQGRTITEFAKGSELTLRNRLGLVCSLCDALEHIHQNGLIHRDLKPDNVIVPEGMERPSPKVLDFGIAKVTTGHRDNETLDGAILGTLEYASPEQLTDSRHVDVRSDIYSAGVILYELLTGTRPFLLSSAGLGGFLDSLRDKDAEPPSERLVETPEPLARAAAGMRTTTAALLAALREDLDWIVLKALNKNPSERYNSAGALRADIRRYLDGLPVSAHPPTRGYAVRKFFRRHRTPVVAALVVVLSLVVGVAATTVQYALAQGRLRDLERLATDLVSSVNEIQDIPGGMLAKERIVASAARTLEKLGRRRLDLAGQARLAEAFERVGQLRADPYTASLGQTSAGASDLCRAFELRRKIHEIRPDATTAKNLMHSGLLLTLVLQSGLPPPPDADSLLKAVIAIGRPFADETGASAELHRELALCMDLSAEYECALGRWRNVRTLIEQARDYRQHLLDADPASEAWSREVSQSLGRLAYATSSPESARAYASASLVTQQAYFENHPFSYRAHLDLTFALRNAAYALQRSGQAGAALPLYQRCVTLRRIMAATDSIDLRSQHQLANALDWLSAGWVAVGRADSALAAAQEALAIRRKVVAALVWAPAGEIQSQRTLARAELSEGHYDAAESHYRLVCADTSVFNPLYGLKTWRDLVELVHAMQMTGRAAEADSVLAVSGYVLNRVEAFLYSYGGHEAPFADLALAYLHLAQVRRVEPEVRFQYLERAARLPGIGADPREALALVENEWGCLLASTGDIAGAMVKLRRARMHCRRAALRETIGRNGALCFRLRSPGPATGGSRGGPVPHIAPYDASKDPYSRLDLVLFRMLPMWGEHPEPPAARLLMRYPRAGGDRSADPRQAETSIIGHGSSGDSNGFGDFLDR